MKLSEAIREGAKLRPMAEGEFFVMGREGLASCALGAAYEAAGHEMAEAQKLHYAIADVIEDDFPVLAEAWADAPDERHYTLMAVISGMNDSGLWTREEIADWLESIGY